MTAPLVKEKKVLEDAIRRHPNQKSLYASLTRVLSKLRQSIPSHIERVSLEYFIDQFPERSDLFRRLCFLRLQQKEQLSEEEIDRAFPEYVGIGETYSFLAPLFEAAQAEGNASHLESIARFLRDRFPECPVCLYFRADWLFHFGDSAEALTMLKAAQSLVKEYDYLARLYITVLHYEGRPGGDTALRIEARNFIQELFAWGNAGDLWREPNFTARQAVAIKRGIPPVLIVTLPKSGSLFLLNTLRRGLSIPYTYLCPLGLYYDAAIEQRVQDFAKGGAIAVDHLQATKFNLDMLYRHGIRKIVFHYRDVRQATLSFVHHSTSAEIVTEPKDKVLDRGKRIEKERRAFETAYRQYFLDNLSFMANWVKAVINDKRFEFLVTNFDDLEYEKELTEKILNFYHVASDAFDWTVLNSDKKMRAGHFRKGLKEEWRQVLAPEFKAEIEVKLQEATVISKLEEYKKESWARW